MSGFVRSFPLEDIAIRSGGDGRTVEAYAAVFDHPVEITDGQGTYMERIAKTAFDRTIGQRGTNFGVFYNHARTIHGQSSDMFSLPIGRPEEVREDARGLVTVTRYNDTPLARQVLESIRNGDIRGQSFSGRFVSSTPAPPKIGIYGANVNGDLTTVTRTEVAMVEYGPTPFPAYDEAAILGVRAMLSSLLTPEQLEHLLALATRDSGSDEGNHHLAPAGSVAVDPPDGHSVRQWTAEQQALAARILTKGQQS
jgi:HK97 family phage prohead protease